MLRPLNKIAADILRDWGPTARDNRKAKPYQIFGMPYVDAMLELTCLSDHYGLDDAEDILLRFLVNVASWRGDFARSIKQELNAHLKEKHHADDDADDDHG